MLIEERKKGENGRVVDHSVRMVRARHIQERTGWVGRCKSCPTCESKASPSPEKIKIGVPIYEHIRRASLTKNASKVEGVQEAHTTSRPAWSGTYKFCTALRIGNATVVENLRVVRGRNVESSSRHRQIGPKHCYKRLTPDRGHRKPVKIKHPLRSELLEKFRMKQRH
ncbi:hypothetical protein BJV78DRAFT_751661 [Lactifluus subvellereus]|nr:hypothetical protein BJV78DRAFT_751661 [Lactifluus subvellereus]